MHPTVVTLIGAAGNYLSEDGGRFIHGGVLRMVINWSRRSAEAGKGQEEARKEQEEAREEREEVGKVF